MKCYTGKYTARRIRFTIPLLVILLTVSPIPAQAGVIDTVNNKVTTILKKVKSIASNTSGLQEFITTLRDIRDSMGSGMISDLRESMGEAQDLIQFIKDRRESAGQTSQYPSLPNLVRSLSDVSDVLTDRDGQGGALEGISTLLDVLPDRALAPIARGVSRAGVDADFVTKIDQMAIDLAELRLFLSETEYGQADPSHGLIIEEFQCNINDPVRLIRLNRAAKATKNIAGRAKLLGATIDAVSDSIQVKKGVGIWGWVNAEVEAKPGQTLGKLMVVMAEGVLFKVDQVQGVIDTCAEQALGA